MGGMVAEDRTLRGVLEFVKSIRALVDPNIGFLKQLLDLERSNSSGNAESEKERESARERE